MGNKNSKYQNPFEVTRTEYFNSDYPLIAHNFRKPSFFQDLIERDRFVIFGTRGTGKTMILKSIYFPVYLEILKKDKIDVKNYKHNFIGVYIPCDNLEFQKYFNYNYIKHFGDGDIEKGKKTWKSFFENYFTLYVLEEVIKTIWNNRNYINHNLKKELENNIKELIELLDPLNILKLDFNNFGELIKVFRKERMIFTEYVDRCIYYSTKEYNRPIKGLDFVKDFCNFLVDKIKSLRNIRFYLLLDDFFPPFLSIEQQKLILDLARERKGSLSFKFATIPEGMCFITDSGYEMRPSLDYTVQHLDHTKVSSGSKYWHMVKDINTLRLQSIGIDSDELFETPKQNSATFLKKLRGEISKGHDLPVYAGFNMVVEISSGVIGEYMLLAREMINFLIQSKHRAKLLKIDIPIPIRIQDEVIRRRSVSLLKSIKSLRNGLSIYKLVIKMQMGSRERFIKNKKAKEHIQYNIKDYENIQKDAHDIMIEAFRNNIIQSPEKYPTQRQQRVILQTLILNRLLTPALRIPYRDRWKIDIGAEDINRILLSDPETPIEVTENPPISTKEQSMQLPLEMEDSMFLPIFNRNFCNVFSENCNIYSELQILEDGIFLALPFREDFHKYTEKFIKEIFPNVKTSIDASPNGDFVCKICQLIHKKKYGIYELTILNDNVILEMGLSLGIGKHTFHIWCEEMKQDIWRKEDSPILDLLSGLEGIKYNVTEDSIKGDFKDIILKTINLESWNKKRLKNGDSAKNGIFLALPIFSIYYQKTLKGEALRAIDEVGLKEKVLQLPENFKSGINFLNSFQWVKNADLCVIDTTRFDYDDIKYNCDYLWRMFCLGLAIGMRKPLIHCFNTTYSSRTASDIRGKVTFTYKDTELFEKLLFRIKEVVRDDK